jgi:hypothetical protein
VDSAIRTADKVLHRPAPQKIEGQVLHNFGTGQLACGKGQTFVCFRKQFLFGLLSVGVCLHVDTSLHTHITIIMR